MNPWLSTRLAGRGKTDDIGLVPVLGELREGDSDPDPPRRNPVVAALSSRIDAICGPLVALADGLLVLAVVFEVVTILVDIIGRQFFGFSVLWVQQAAVEMLILVTFVGGAVAYARDVDVRVVLIHHARADATPGLVSGFRDAVTLVLSIELAVLGYRFAQTVRGTLDPFLHVSQYWLFLPLPVGMALIALFAVRQIARPGGPRVRVGNVAGLVVSLAAYLAVPGLALDPGSATATALLLGLCVVALILGFPLALVFAFGSMEFLHTTGLSILSVPVDMIDGVSNFVLVSIPLFLIVGYVMSSSSLGDRMTEGVQAVVGRLPGGILHAIVIAMFVMSGISGSKLGDMAAVGGPAVRIARRAGHSGEEATAVLVAGAIMGDTIPPSIALLILASVTTLPTAALFAGGLLPAALVGVGLMLVIWLRYRRRERPAGDAGNRPRAIAAALPVAVIPVFMVAGILSGFASPSEIGAIALLYTVATAMIVRPRLGAKALYRAGRDGITLAASVLMIIATSTVFARQLTISQVPQRLSNELSGGGRIGFLLLSTILLIVLGMVMEGIPCILVVTPILLPVASSLGINPLQFGLLIVIAVGIGANAPPLGIGALVGARVGGVEADKLLRPMGWYLVVALVGYAAVAAVPDLTLWLPRVFGLG